MFQITYECFTQVYTGRKKIGEKEKKNLMRVNTQACEIKGNKI